MDRGLVCDQLGVTPGGTFWIKDVHFFGWGSEVVFECHYDLPGSDPVPFQMVMLDCRELQWRVYAHLQHPEDRTLPATAIVNLRLGTAGQRKPLQVLTDAFALTVHYGTLSISRVGGGA
ncbi:MAG: hypothetical protein J0M33_07755 [Anaerolineae bacterium]|nr:hypothetical protein [Anaerolineae bacterium]